MKKLLIKIYRHPTLKKAKKHPVVKKIRKNTLFKKLCKLFFIAVGWLPVKEKLIVFESFNGKQYSCNPKAIYEYLRETRPDLKMVWSVNPKNIKGFQKRKIPHMKRFSLRWFLTMPRAKYWVTNARLSLWISKPKHTIYVQTWHGTPLKRLAADMDEVHMPGTTTEKYKQNFIHEASKWDFLVSPNAYSSEIFKRAFGFRKRMIESGYPRNDILYTNNNEEHKTKLKQKHKIPVDKKVVLYAPTWRDDQYYKKGKYKFDLELDLNLLREHLGEEYVILLRMHYLIAENFDLKPYKGFVYDFSKNIDINNLYLISDLLVTDYSSVFFDFANLRRPIIFFTYDIEEYRDKLRGFYFDLESEAPGPVVTTSEEVLQAIQYFENGLGTYQEMYDRFYDRFCYLEDGLAAKRVVDEIMLPKNHSQQQSYNPGVSAKA